MISVVTRRTVRSLYAFACGYCGISETEVGSELTIDHFMPQDAGGTDDINNLVYACFACNLHKSSAWNLQEQSVLHPLQTDMSSHVRTLPDGTLEGLTPEGQRHIATLHLNRFPMVERRRTRRLLDAVMRREAEFLERGQQLNRGAHSKKDSMRRKKKR